MFSVATNHSTKAIIMNNEYRFGYFFSREEFQALNFKQYAEFFAKKKMSTNKGSNGRDTIVDEREMLIDDADYEIVG
jgi:hypothetical protein